MISFIVQFICDNIGKIADIAVIFGAAFAVFQFLSQKKMSAKPLLPALLMK